MRDVLPLWIIFDAVVKAGRPDRKCNDTLAVQTALAIRVRISFRDSLVDLGSKTVPLLLGRFLLHPPVHYREATGKRQQDLFTCDFLQPAIEAALRWLPSGFSEMLGDLLPGIPAPEQLENETHFRAPFLL
jgi:hypothetical protein